MMFITPMPPTTRLMLPTAPSSSVITPSCDSICSMSWRALFTSTATRGLRSRSHSATSRTATSSSTPGAERATMIEIFASGNVFAAVTMGTNTESSAPGSYASA